MRNLHTLVLRQIYRKLNRIYNLKSKCKYCRSSRRLLIVILAGLIVINYYMRSILDFKTESVYDVIVLPFLVTVLLAITILVTKGMRRK